jgi:hypothetical protein
VDPSGSPKFQPDFLLNELENYDLPPDEPEEEQDQENSSEADTVYGIRTNFNAVNEYLSLLLKFFKEKGKYSLPKTKNMADVILKKSYYQAKDIKKINDGLVEVPPEEKTIKGKKRPKCFEDPVPECSLISLDHFTELENEILVRFPLERILTIKSNYQNMNIVQELFDMQRVYHRAIFDCFNEGLSNTIYDNDMSLIDAIPPKKLTREKQEHGDLLLVSKEYVLDAASLLCGIISDKEDSMMGNIRYMDQEFIK